jgi:hypothetical protein
VEPRLSRRAARALQHAPDDFGPAERRAFAAAVERATGFDDLAVKWQRFIRACEARRARAARRSAAVRNRVDATGASGETSAPRPRHNGFERR